ncbi:MAG: inner membrane-spanning protein YciB [Paracoccaceae bacterium]
MTPRKINPILKMVLEFGPVLAFFIAYGRVKDRTFSFAGTEYSGFIAVTAAFILLMLIATALLWVLTGRLSRMQVATMVLVVVMGGLSVWLNDDRFFKMKPTLIYLLFAAILGFGLMRGKSYLRYVMEEVMPLQPQGWMILTRRVLGFFIILAIANEAIWRTQSTDTWVTFKTFGLMLATFLFFMAQGRLFSTYAIEDAETPGE